jgi:hypothetical protein
MAAAAVTALVAAVANGLDEAINGQPDGAPPPVLRGMGAFIFAFPYALVGLLVLGLPYAFILRKFRAETAAVYAVGGAGLGVIWLFVLLRSLNAAALVSGALFGCLCALCWWWLRPKS